jgi:group I intron endonuclease
MTSGVYAIVNKENGKRYIGSSICIERRWREHLRNLRHNKHHSSYLQNAWNKYKEYNFDFVIIQECPVKSLTMCEQFYLDEEVPSEYNCCLIAKIQDMSPEAIAKRFEGRIGKAHPHKGGNNGKICSEETKKKMSLAHIGQQTAKGYHHTKETKNRISAASKGRNIGNKFGIGNKSNTGKNLTVEHCSKISASLVGNTRNKNRRFTRDVLGRFEVKDGS